MVPVTCAVNTSNRFDADRWMASRLAFSGDLESLVAEVGDELEGSAEASDVAVQDVLSGNVALSIWEARATETPIWMATCS